MNHVYGVNLSLFLDSIKRCYPVLVKYSQRTPPREYDWFSTNTTENLTENHDDLEVNISVS